MSHLKRLFLTRNVGTADRVLRALPAVIVTWAWAQGHVAGPVAVILGIVSAMLLVTAIIGTCSIYGIFGLSTRKRIESNARGSTR